MLWHFSGAVALRAFRIPHLPAEHHVVRLGSTSPARVAPHGRKPLRDPCCLRIEGFPPSGRGHAGVCPYCSAKLCQCM